MKHLIRTGFVGLLVLAVMVTASFMPSVTIRQSGGFISISADYRIEAQGGLSPEQINEAALDELPEKSISSTTKYKDVEGTQRYIDNSWARANPPYSWEMLHDDYHIRVTEDVQSDQVIQFEVDGNSVSFKPSSLHWTNDLNLVQSIPMSQTAVATVGHSSDQLTKTVQNNKGFIKWNDLYGTGLNLQWQCTPGTLEKVFEIENFNNLPVPSKAIVEGKNPVLELVLAFSLTDNIEVLVNNEVWDKRTTVTTSDFIQFVKDGKVVWFFKPLQYWCSDNGLRDGESVATLKAKDRDLFVSIRVPYLWLQTAVYPVFIDADVAINTATQSTLFDKAGRSGIFWKSTTVGYLVYIDSTTDLKYRKTSDGGAAWGAAVNMRTGSVAFIDCWADWQTAGDTGTKIHIVYTDYATSNIRYCYLETATDTIAGDDLVETVKGTGALYSSGGLTHNFLSTTKTRGGNIAITLRYTDSGGTAYYNFYTSPNGDTWTSKTSPWEAANDYMQLYAGNEADNQDIWATFWDISADEISLKTFDNSGNVWDEVGHTETTISGAGNATESTSYLQMDGQVRLSDGHLIFAAWNLLDNAAADLMVWDINGAASITAKTNVITNEAETATVSVFINQVNDDIYITYCSGSAWLATVQVFYQKSTNGGTNWGGETAMQADAEDDERWVSAGCMKASLGGKFQPVWFNDDLNYIYCNVANAITISAAASFDISNTPSSKAFGIVACSTTYYAFGSAPSNPVVDGECTFAVTNNAASACDLDMKVSDFTGGVGWNIGAPGANQARITAYYSGQNPASGLVLANTDAEFYDGLAASAHIHWDFKFETPTSVTDGSAKSATLTITAVAED